MKNWSRLVLIVLLASSTGFAVEVTQHEGSAHGFPAVFQIDGQKIANGDFSQSFDGEQLHIRIVYRYETGERIEEKAILRQGSQLIQEQWSWRESNGTGVEREFLVDFKAQTATAKKREDGQLKSWSERVEVQPGRTFAGFGFTLALQNLRKRLIKGETIELEAIGFNPKPVVVTVELAHGGVDEMKMGGRIITGDRFVVHPKLPAMARIFVHVPDTKIWLTKPPAGFLRWEGPLAEPKDPIIRVDLIPGEQSGPARVVDSVSK